MGMSPLMPAAMVPNIPAATSSAVTVQLTARFTPRRTPRRLSAPSIQPPNSMGMATDARTQNESR